MRWIGIIMAVVGFFAVFGNLMLGNPWIVPYLVWGAVGVVGVIIVASNRGKQTEEPKEGKSGPPKDKQEE